MTEQESEAIYTELVEILNSNHFSWIVDYVEGVRSEDEEARDADDEDEVGAKELHQPSLLDARSFPGMILLNPPGKRSQLPTSFHRRRLGLLIDATERALVHPMEMAGEVTAFFSEYAHVEAIDCFPDIGRGKKFMLNRDEILALLPVAGELKALLKELREELEHDRA
jgi:hypothetical protein